jgi:lysophospholipase L1-like esterase
MKNTCRNICVTIGLIIVCQSCLFSCKGIGTAVQGVLISNDTLQLFVGTSQKIEASVLPNNADNKGLTYYCDNESVARVDKNGTVMAVARGKAMITVTSQADNNISINICVLVSKKHTGPQAVFMGNSITELWANRPFFVENYYVNKGISGQVVSQMLNRFQKDVIDLNPHSVVILGGTNDLAQNPNYSPTLEGIFKNITDMAELAANNDIKVFLCSVTPVDYYPGKLHLKPTAQIVALNEMIKNYAAEHDMIYYVDYHTALKTENNILRPEYMASPLDPVHVSPAAYDVMERIIKQAITSVLNK